VHDPVEPRRSAVDVGAVRRGRRRHARRRAAAGAAAGRAHDVPGRGCARSRIDLHGSNAMSIVYTAAATAGDAHEIAPGWELICGLEVHCELSTSTKLFCGCPNHFGAEPNTNVCPVCLGLPGSLPVLNGAAVEFAMRLGRALHCTVNSA